MLQELLKTLDLEVEDIGRPFEAEVCSFPKGGIITPHQKVENYIYLLRKGSVKVSYFKELNEYILDFWFEGDFFTSYASFIQRIPSLTEITALSEVEVERIHFSQLEAMYERSLLGNQIGRKMAERMYVHKTMKEIELISLSAEERYRKLLNKSRDLVLEVSVKDLASYLGIQPESLSRIRRKILS